MFFSPFLFYDKKTRKIKEVERHLSILFNFSTANQTVNGSNLAP